MQEHEISGHEPYRSWCRACVAGRGRADAHVGRPGVEKGVPIIGVDCGYLWSRAPEASDASHDEAQLQPREELEAALDSICKHIKELGALHVAESDVGEIFLPGRSAKLGSAFSELPGAVVDLRFGWDLASAAGRQECWKTLHAERPELVIGSPPSRRHSHWIKDEREARIQGIKHLNFCCACIDGKQSVEYTFSMNIHGELPRGTWTA